MRSKQLIRTQEFGWRLSGSTLSIDDSFLSVVSSLKSWNQIQFCESFISLLSAVECLNQVVFIQASHKTTLLFLKMIYNNYRRFLPRFGFFDGQGQVPSDEQIQKVIWS